MYGVLLQSVRRTIIAKYGDATWEQIGDFIGIDSDSILARKIYPDSLFEQIIKCLMMLCQAGDSEIYMELFGRNFVGHIGEFGYDKIIRVAGRCFRNFLHSIDQIHESNRYSFPEMQHPLFYVSGEDADGLFLHYQSKRRGFNAYVIGQLKECAKKFFDKDIRVLTDKDLSDNEFNHVVFRIEFDNSDYIESQTIAPSAGINVKRAQISTISSKNLLANLPYCLGIDKDLNVKHVSSRFRRIFEDTLDGKNINKVFEVLKPAFIESWESLVSFSHSIAFEIQNKRRLPSKVDKSVKIVFKGQMKLVEELGLVLFIGRPIIKSIDEMYDHGIFLNDLNKFDSSTEMIVRDLLDDLIIKKTQGDKVWSVHLERLKANISAEQKKNMSLLGTKIPSRFMNMLERGVPANNVSMAFDSVTALFVTINGLDVDSEARGAMEIIESHRTIIEDLDAILESYECVSKVNTKVPGTFVVVAGIDEPEDRSRPSSQSGSNVSAAASTLSMIDLDDEAPFLPKKRFPGYNHAELVATVALEIREFLGKFPDLSCELGFESGSAIGGLIGDETSGLQFCLFGQIVNLAKSFSTLEKEIRFGPSSFKLLKDSPHFNCQLSGKLNLKTKSKAEGNQVLDSYIITESYSTKLVKY